MAVREVFAGAASRETNGASTEQVLTHPLRLRVPEEERASLTELINRTAESPFARSVLEKAGELGYEVCIGDLGQTVKGCCRSSLKQVVLSDKQTPDTWVATLVHECRHAAQIAQGATAGYSPFLSLSSQLKEKRLMEADACAAAARACHELLERGDYMPSVLAHRSQSTVQDAYDNAAEKGGPAKAMTAAALAWYDNELYKMAYEMDHIMEPMSCGGAFLNHSAMFEEQPVADSIAKICRGEDGKTYFSEPYSTLEKPHYAGISAMTAKWLDEHTAACEKLGTPAEPSLKTIPVYDSTPFVEASFEKKYGKLPPVLNATVIERLELKRKCGEKVFENKPRIVPKRPEMKAFWQQIKFER